ncbi:MAG: hypothetical protein O2862_08780 [Bacteroidetes bacterium]|nr:hypothetical protein [Bacteroidota bacterium]
MKATYLILALLLSVFAFGQSPLEIPAGERVQIGYPDHNNLAITLKNKSGLGLDVSTINNVSGEQISGFGLGPSATATVTVVPLGVLEIKNASDKSVLMEYSITESKPVATDENEKYVSFTLGNETLKSIPLIISGVMNPNLSPQSNSGVRLKMGQEIKYRKALSTRVLLTVDETIKEGEVVLVGELLSEVLN